MLKPLLFLQCISISAVEKAIAGNRIKIHQGGGGIVSTSLVDLHEWLLMGWGGVVGGCLGHIYSYPP